MEWSEIVIKPDGDGVFVLYNDDPYINVEEYLKKGFKSIWHYLLNALSIHPEIYSVFGERNKNV